MRFTHTFGKALAVAAISGLALTACGGSNEEPAASGDALPLVQPGTLTVCSDIPYPPFEFQEGNEYTGFDMDLIREIAGTMDLEVAIQDVSFDGLQSGVTLAAGQCDLGASAMTITPEREQNLAFSDPYYDSLQSLLVPEGSDIKAVADLAGKSVGVQAGTTGETYTRENVRRTRRSALSRRTPRCTRPSRPGRSMPCSRTSR
jgi:polar amino acid transport system substrate-binding protein